MDGLYLETGTGIKQIYRRLVVKLFVIAWSLWTYTNNVVFISFDA